MSHCPQAAPQYTITASAGTGGVIAPSRTVTVNSGASQTFTITPNAGYQVTDVLIDGSSVGPVLSYTFTNVTANHTISASFFLPAQLTTALISATDAVGFEQGTALLQNALRQLNAGVTTAACNQVAAFVNQVRAQTGKQLTSAQANNFLSQATQIRGLLGCH